MLTFGSLFAGIGGLDLGLERAGMVCKWQVEIDDYATKVLTKHWPNVPRFRDVRSVGAHNLPAVDCICGGFPCQPHSEAGLRQGKADDRDLWPEFARLICELKPRWVLAENVTGLFTTDTGRFFGSVLRDLATLGYDAEWSTVSACSLGAPHPRERVFVVAYTAGERGEWRGIGATGGTGRGASHSITRQVQGGFWAHPDDSLYRVADGLSGRLDKGKRLSVLGNSVVPQVAELIGHWIVAHAGAEQEQRKAA